MAKILLLFGVLVGFVAAVHATSSTALDEKLRSTFTKPAYVMPRSIPFTEENPDSDAKAELGRVLFFDQRLSRAGNQSCVSCHHPGLGWEMGLPKALGAQEMPRKSPTLLNLAWNDSWFWDGRADSYATQFHMALISPKALAMTSEELVKRLEAVPGYAPLFKRAFKEGAITEKNVAAALEIYQRRIVSGPAPFDRWVQGDNGALTAAAKRGALVFAGKANCIACHSGFNFTDNGFHDVGLNDEDPGRGKIKNLPSLQHAFKTPSLRSIASRAPYMHAGQLRTLEDVVEHYDRGGEARRPSLAPEMKALGLTREEKRDLIEFLRSLTGEQSPVQIPMMPM